MKWRSKFIFVLVLAAVFGCVFFLTRGNHYRRDLEAYKRDLVAKGEKLTMIELAPPPSHDTNRVQQLTNLMNSYRLPANLPASATLIAPGVWLPGFLDVSPAQMRSFDSNTVMISQLHDILGTNALSFDLDFSSGPNVRFPPFGNIRDAAVVASTTASQALATNAIPQFQSAMDVSLALEKFTGGNLQLSELVRFAITRLAIANTWAALQSGRLGESQLSELQAKWASIDFFGSTGQTLRMERAYDVAALEECRKTNPVAPLNLSYLASSNAPTDSSGLPDRFWVALKELYDRYPGYWSWRSSWSYDEELCLLQEIEMAQQADRSAVLTGSFAVALKEYDHNAMNLAISHPEGVDHFRFFDIGYGEVLSSYVSRAALTETARRLTVTAIALKRYHLAHSAYPASLSELVPQYLPQVPTDFMDGKPLRYKPRPDGTFLLYSVGEDGEDNGGDPSPTGTNPNDWTRGRDMVWPRAATQKEIDDYLKSQRQGTAASSN